jgi:hypothetical protein
VDSLFPSYVVLISYIQNHSHTRTVTKNRPECNRKRRVQQRHHLVGAEAAAVAATAPGISHSCPEANSLGVRVEQPCRAAFVICRCAGGRVFCSWTWCVASTTAAPLLFIYHRSFAPYISPSPRLLTQTPRAWAVAWVPALSSGGALAVALALTAGCARALLRAWSMILCKLKLLLQAQGFAHHLLSLPLAILLILASRWPLLLTHARRWPLLHAPTSCQSIPNRQFASTSPQSSWTMYLTGAS